MPVICTGISLPTEQRDLLRQAARGMQRAAGGGRASVSALLADLVSRHEDELNKMAQGKIIQPLEACRTGSV
jgi:hypothetical protein